MVKACVLIKSMPGKIPEVLSAVRKVENVEKAYSALGRYDVVAFIEAPDHTTASQTTLKINALENVRSSETAIET